MSTFNHDEVAGSIIRLTLESESESHSVMSNSLRPHGLYRPWSSPGLNTGIIAQACGGAARTKCKLQNKRNL